MHWGATLNNETIMNLNLLDFQNRLSNGWNKLFVIPVYYSIIGLKLKHGQNKNKIN